MSPYLKTQNWNLYFRTEKWNIIIELWSLKWSHKTYLKMQPYKSIPTDLINFDAV